MTGGVRLGLVDSGLSDRHRDAVRAGRRFVADDDGGLHQGPVTPDLMGHGGAVADIILHHAPGIRLCNAQVFDARGVTTAATVAAAIDWLRGHGVDVISLSLGLQNDRTVLRAACARAVAEGVVLVAAAPAQGRAVYPASYPGVIRATGDARCAATEISFLDSAQADFGGCPRILEEALEEAREEASDGGPNRSPRIGGASMGCAHVAGQVAAYLDRGGDKTHVRQWLVSQAKYRHSERRTK